MNLRNECIVMAMAVWLAGGIHAADSGVIALRISAAPSLESPEWHSVREETLQPVDTGGFWSPFERRSGMTGKVLEPGLVQLMWSPDALYVRCRLTDSDLVASPQNRDQSAIYMAADAVELFLKCDDSPCYWEFHGSIDGKKSGWRYSSRGRLGLPGTDVRSAVTVTVQEEGTRNHLGDRDANWQILFRVDAEELRRGSGCPWPGERRWRMQLVRYNYSQYLPCREVSVFPKMREFNPHLTEDYAEIRFVEKSSKRAEDPVESGRIFADCSVVLFDIDNTITYYKNREFPTLHGNFLFPIIRDLMVERGWRKEKAEEAILAFIGRIPNWDYPDFFAAFDLPPREAFRRCREWHEKYIGVNQDALALIDTLRKQGKHLAIASNNPYTGCLWKLQQAGLADENGSSVFCKIFSTDVVRGCKGDPAVWPNILARLPYLPEKIGMVGDNPLEDSDLPRKYGMKVIYLFERDQPRLEFGAIH